MNIHSYIDQPTSLKQQTINLRTYERNIPSQPLQPYLDSRPVLTKYTILPIVDHRKMVKTPLIQEPTYHPDKIFNPGNNKGPWSGYASNIHHESDLRNQLFALQSCGQAIYVPSSKSSLYDVKWQNRDIPQQPFPSLFENQSFCPNNRNVDPDKIGYALFNNATRQQMKDLTKETKCSKKNK